MDLLKNYFASLRDKCSYGAGTKETSFYPCLVNLLDAAGALLKPKVQCLSILQNTGAGNPDGGLFDKTQMQKGGHGPRAGQVPSRGVIEIKGTKDDAVRGQSRKAVSEFFKEEEPMKRVRLGVVLLTIAFSVGLFAQSDAGPQCLETVPDYWAPWVNKATTHSVTINWHGEASGTGVVEYATSDYYGKHQRFNKQVKAKTPATYQHVKLPGLKPDTSYIYRVRPSGNLEAFGNRTFRTMPLSGPFTFIVISDTQEGPHYPEAKRFKLVADAVATEPDVLFILHGGDNARFDDAGRWALYFEAADAMLAKFPIFTAIGNHEHHDINNPDNPPTPAVQYNSCYDVPLHYAFDCAGVRFVILETPDVINANGDDPHTSLALAESQRSWLEKQLRNDMLGTFTLHHHPIWDYFNTMNNPNLQPWEDLYHEYSISAAFAGHTHDYQRYDVAGIPYFIVGDAGGDCADLVSPNPPPVWYQFGKAKILGYLKVTVYPKSNLAIAQEIFVASVLQDDDDETPTLFDPPLMSDAIAFPLVRKGTP